MPYRNPKLLSVAKECPHCMHCFRSVPVVGCHSNSLKHGKGMGIKAHDIPAYLCDECHDLLDGRVPSYMGRREKEEMFLNAVFWSMLWIFSAGKAVVK